MLAIPTTTAVIFDMDGTLIHTKSRKINPVDCNDWIFWHSTVPDKIQEAKEAGYRIVIVSNQKGVSLGLTTKEELKQKG